MASFLAPSLVAFALLIVSIAAQSENPCHRNRNPTVMGENACEKVVIPSRFTTNCNIKPFNPDGTFRDCTSIYDLDDPPCKRTLLRYSQKNPCDRLRANLLNAYYNEGDMDAAEQLDYFLYSMAEECCDCIPERPNIEGFTFAVGTISVFRGNCAAHAYIDICKIYPNIKMITTSYRATRTPPVEDLPYICPDLREWRGNEGLRWSRQNVTVLSEPIEAYLKEAMIGLRCRKATVWNRCFELESAQDRV